jgi:ABC-type glycerol-3-phosphate transport system substrate-binding protein
MRALLLLLFLTLTGCGISQSTKDASNAVFGHSGILEHYIDATNSITRNQIVLLQAIQDQHGDIDLQVVYEDGSTGSAKISQWLEALEVILEFGEPLKDAAHALNGAIQADKGVSEFVEQLIRTMRAKPLREVLFG